MLASWDANHSTRPFGWVPAAAAPFRGSGHEPLRERSTSQQHHLSCLRPALPHTDCVTLSLDRRRILDRWDRSGLSASAFAPSVGVSPWTLYAWLQRTRGGRLASGGGDGCVPSTAIVPAFVEISAIAGHAGDHGDGGAGRIEISLPRDLTVRVAPGFDADTLRRAVEAILPSASA